LSLTTCGAKRRLKPTMTIGAAPFAAASVRTASISRSSSVLSAIGFSTKTCLPARSAWHTIDACESCRVEITMAFTAGSRNTPSVSVVVDSKPNLRPACSPLTPPLEATVRRRAPAALNAGMRTPVA
jgi:hypothetical protein